MGWRDGLRVVPYILCWIVFLVDSLRWCSHSLPSPQHNIHDPSMQIPEQMSVQSKKCPTHFGTEHHLHQGSPDKLMIKSELGEKYHCSSSSLLVCSHCRQSSLDERECLTDNNMNKPEVNIESFRHVSSVQEHAPLSGLD